MPVVESLVIVAAVSIAWATMLAAMWMLLYAQANREPDARDGLESD